MFYDIALKFDAASFSCDLELDETGDLLIDETPVTPMLLSVGLDVRAALDDELPQGREIYLVESGLNLRRGSPCDFLDGNGARIGSKCWLLDRAKETEETKLLYAMWLDQALEWTVTELGKHATIVVAWVRPQLLQWLVQIEDYSLLIKRKIF